MNERFLNPNWLKIWVKPRAVIRSILDGGSYRHIHKLAMIGGIGRALFITSNGNLGDKFPVGSILVFCFVVGPLLGLFSLYAWSAFITWTGRWFGGTGTQGQVRVANAWAAIPQIYGAFLWLAMIAWLGDEAFQKHMPRLEDPHWLTMLLYFLVFAIHMVWMLIVEVKAVAEVHRFSFWKGLLAAVTARILLILALASPFLVIYGLIVLL
jgi:hypothetical protein